MKENDVPTLATLRAAKADLEKRIAKLINSFEETYDVTVSITVDRDYSACIDAVSIGSIITIK